MMKPLSERGIGLCWALSSAVGGALMVIPWKLANEVGIPAQSVMLLLGVSAIATTVLAIGQAIREGGSGGLALSRTGVLVAMVLAVFTLLGNTASAIAIRSLSPALLNVLLRADVIFVALMGWILLGEHVERRFWLGALIAVFGLYVLQGPAQASDLRSVLAGGTGMAVASAACFSGLAIVTRRFITRINPIAVNALRLWLAVGFWLLINPWPRFSEIPGEQILYASVAAIAGPTLGRIALMISARHLEARVTTLATLSTPALTLILAFFLLGDWPRSYELLGGAIMIGGISIPLLRPRKPEGLAPAD